MRARQSFGALLLASGLALSLTSAALAQPVDDNTRNTARSLAGQGKDAFDAQAYDRAFDLFHRAYALVPAPTIALYEAQSLVKLGRFVEAEEAYMRAVRTPLDAHASEQFREAVKDAERELAELQPRIPKATIVVSGPAGNAPDLVVELDGKRLPAAVIGVEMPIDPGDHVLYATAQGGEPAELNFEISERERQRVEIRPTPGARVEAPKPAPPEPPPRRAEPRPTRAWQKPLGFAVTGFGVAGVGAGIVTGLMAGSRHATAEKECPGHICIEGSSGADALDAFRTLRTVSTIGYVLGGVGLAAGITLLVTAPKKPAEASASLGLRLGASGVDMMGAF